MEINHKKLERRSRILYYTISVVLCLFLILLSNRIIDDLDSSVAMPAMHEYEQATSLRSVEIEIDKHNTQLDNLYTKRTTIEKTIAHAKDNYANEKQSFDNWLQTRKTLGSPDKDAEVTERARKLDESYKVEQEWRTQLQGIQGKIEAEDKAKQALQRRIEEERAKAEKKYRQAFSRYELHVFLVRLLFVAPVLGLGIFFFIRFRRHTYWPLYFGFTLFSLYAFFFGLVPYLPSYGGYVRYTVGILLSVGMGYYGIKRIREYIESKKSELQVSTQERAKKVQTETAEKALENHFCPSCGKDFILKKWEFPLAKNEESSVYKLVTSFCRHCGLALFTPCAQCGTKNFAHLPYCATCGAKVQKGNE